MSLANTVMKCGVELLDMWVQKGILPAFPGSSMSQISGMLHPGLGERRERKKKNRQNVKEQQSPLPPCGEASRGATWFSWCTTSPPTRRSRLPAASGSPSPCLRTCGCTWSTPAWFSPCRTHHAVTTTTPETHHLPPSLRHGGCFKGCFAGKGPDCIHVVFIST